MPQAHAVLAFVSDPGSPSLLAGLWCGFLVHAENLMDSVVGYVYSKLGFDYVFQVDCAQLVLVVGVEDHGGLL